MENNNNKELIEHIKDVLDTYEEPYQLGAWERFQLQQKKQPSFLILKFGLSTAASLAVIAVSVWLVTFRYSEINPSQFITNPTNEILNEKAKLNDRIVGAQMKDYFHEETLGTGTEVTSILPGAVVISLDNKQPINANHLNENIFIPSGIKEYIKPLKPVSINHHKPVVSGGMPKGYPVFTLNKDSKPDNSEISFGLAFSPAISTGEAEPNIGIGGGVSVDWSLSRRFSVASGIYVAQNQLIFENLASRAPTLSRLNEMQVNLVSLEIPLNLQFHLNNNFFISAGVSSATFMKEHYSYTYEYDKLVIVTTLAENNEPITTFRVVKVEEKEQIAEPSFNTFNLAAFYNFSIGYQYELTEKYKLSVEPFIKVPAMPVTSSELQYSTGGVQLKIKF